MANVGDSWRLSAALAGYAKATVGECWRMLANAHSLWGISPNFAKFLLV